MSDRDLHRQEAIEEAVQRADRIILEASDGSCEETNYLTAQVAKRLMEKACQPFQSAILKKDLGL